MWVRFQSMVDTGKTSPAHPVESEFVALKGASLVLLAALGVSPVLAAVEEPTAAYLAMKANASAAVGNDGSRLSGDAQVSLNAHYLHVLQGPLQGLIGPFRVDGLPPEGTVRPDDLFEGELGSDALDGLYVSSSDGLMEAVISTRHLLSEWLSRTDKAAHDPRDLLPLDVSKAFTAELFYTWVFADDAHYYTMAELPVALKARAGVAKAILYTHTSDSPGLYEPDGIAVSVEMGDRVVVLKEDFRKDFRVAVLPPCKLQFEADTAKADALLKAYQASPHRDGKLFNAYQKLDDAAHLEYQKCFQRLIPEQPYYSTLVSRAQALVDRVQY